ncbi:MAG: glucose-6-phosphate isomerase [Spirochaetales bacterium]|nr:glucose-6-phosphate isomerase [Spirochaetales bacterium]
MTDIRFTITDGTGTFKEESIAKRIKSNEGALVTAQKGEEHYRISLGWHDVDEWAGEKWLSRYEELSAKVRKDADALVVIGIGGSNQAARAVYEALGQKSSVEIIWAGNSISAHSINEVIKSLEGKNNIYIDCIAKNFETLEPGIGFRAMRDVLRSRYGNDYASHVICTFTEGTHAWKLAESKGYELLPFPADIGGRFTALSPIGLFPLCVAGIDIRAIAAGARHMRERLLSEKPEENMALRYATARTMLAEKGKTVELLSYFEPRFFRFAKWWKQLFGESEGKDDKGLLPMDTCYSEDLHSLGQFVQDGSPMLFETFLDVQKQDFSYVLHDDDVDDRFSYLDGKDFWDINKAAFKATTSAHSKRFPCLILEVPALDEETYGQLFYFFEFACYVSCNITGVNPFDQNGVEAYKIDMFRLLGKN